MWLHAGFDPSDVHTLGSKELWLASLQKHLASLGFPALLLEPSCPVSELQPQSLEMVLASSFLSLVPFGFPLQVKEGL